MNEHISIRNQACPNVECEYFRKLLGSNVKIHSKQNSRFQCAGCKKTWVGHRNDLYYRLRAARQKIDLAFILYEAGKSIREIAKEAKVSPSTIQRWKSLFESHH